MLGWDGVEVYYLYLLDRVVLAGWLLRYKREVEVEVEIEVGRFGVINCLTLFHITRFYDHDEYDRPVYKFWKKCPEE